MATARPITKSERTRIEARLEATREAMADIPEFDADRVRDALIAVDQAHPIDADLREAFLAETRKKMSEPLDFIDNGLNCPVLKSKSPWGLVVYRVSYSDDAAWERILAQINEGLRDSLEMADRQDLLSRHHLVLMNDRSQFDGATVEQVREHFKRWTVDELRRNWRDQPIPEGDIAKFEAGDYPSAGTRYSSCLVVDDICLESLTHMPNPVAKLVNKFWMPDGVDGAISGVRDDNPGWEGGLTNDEFEDVGWMYVHIYSYVDMQNKDSEDIWTDDYVRPPFMDFEDDFETAPGFWRRDKNSSNQI